MQLGGIAAVQLLELLVWKWAGNGIALGSANVIPWVPLLWLNIARMFFVYVGRRG